MAGQTKWGDPENKASRGGVRTARTDLERELAAWEWTVSPDVGIDFDGGGLDRADIMGNVLDALETDIRAHGVGGVAYDEDRRRLGTTFQVHLDPAAEPTVADAVEAAREILADALRKAGVFARVDAISAVRGGDADLLR